MIRKKKVRKSKPVAPESLTPEQEAIIAEQLTALAEAKLEREQNDWSEGRAPYFGGITR